MPIICFRPTSGIYALVDPRTGRTMYIGQSVDVEYRYRQHCESVLFDGHHAKKAWIDGLKAVGLVPRLVVLCESPWPESDEAERNLIAEYRGRGEAELNRADGGMNNRGVSRGKQAHPDDWFQLGLKLKLARESVMDTSRAAAAVAGTGADDHRKVIRALDTWRLKLEAAMSRAYPGRPDLWRVFSGPVQND